MKDAGGQIDLRLTTADLRDRLRLSRTTIWRRRKAGLLPRPIDQGKQCIYSNNEVQTYLHRLAAMRSAGRVNVAAIQRRYLSKSNLNERSGEGE